jgi:hypothetical protein
VSLTVRYPSAEQKGVSDEDGRFRFIIPDGPLTLKVEGKYIITRERTINPGDSAENLRVEIEYTIPPVHESVVIAATTLDPVIDQRNDTIYKNTLFQRDDQLLETLNAGINAGQHEGAGKSLEPDDCVDIVAGRIETENQIAATVGDPFED